MAIPIIEQLETSFAYDPDPGTINVIPQENLNPSNPQNASYEKGFPDITMPNDPSSGRPPNGQDCNGILNATSALLVWYSVGGGFQYNGTLYNNTNPYITGYPIGARVKRSDNQGYWLNLIDNNQTNPDTTGTGWKPDSVYGFYNVIITSTATTQVILTNAQAAYDTILITTTVVPTNPITIVVPSDLSKKYFVINLLPVSVVFKTDNVSSPLKTIVKNSSTILNVINAVYINDLSDTYVLRPNVGSNNYFVEGSGGSLPIPFNVETILPFTATNGQGGWMGNGIITVPFSGVFSINASLLTTVSSANFPVNIVHSIKINGSNYINRSSLSFVDSGSLYNYLSTKVALTAGDTIEIVIISSINVTISTDSEVYFLNFTAEAN